MFAWGFRVEGESCGLLSDDYFCFRNTKQMRFSFLFKDIYETLRVTLLRRRHFRVTFKMNANGYHSDTPWTRYGSLQRTLRLRAAAREEISTHKKTSTDIARHKARKAKRDWETRVLALTQKMDLCVLLAFRQTNRLPVDNRASEVRMKGYSEIHLFTNLRGKDREDAERRKSQNEIGQSEEDILTE